MELQGGNALNFLQGTSSGINLQGSSPRLQASPSSGLSVQPAASGLVLNNPNTRLVSSGGGGSSGGDGGSGGGGGGGGGGGSTVAAAPAVVYPDKSNDIAMQEAGLNAAGATRDAGTSAVDKALATIMGEYDSDAANASKEYGSESNANQGDLQSNKETALQNAVQGRSGLYGTLASLGALNGTGLTLANRAVQKGANDDLTTAADTFATNQNSLDSGYNAFQQQDKTRRTQAQSAHDNDVEQVQNDYFKNEQTYLDNLANDYTAEGKTAQAKGYASQAAALFPQIASTNVPTIDIGYSGSAYTAPTLSSYVGKANNTTVQSTPPATGTNSLFNIPGLVAVNKKQSATAGVPV